MNDNPTVHIELFAGCMRVFPPGKCYGDEYIFSCSLHWINPEEVEVKGVSTLTHSPLAYRKSIGEVLTKHGVKVIGWRRKTKEGEQLIRIDVKTGKVIKEDM